MFSTEVISYIIENENEDVLRLLLRKSPFPDVDIKAIARQIKGRQIAKKKFPFLLDYPQYIYPEKISLEQASSDTTAYFKSKLIDGESIVDLTGGMGIDCYILGQKFKERQYIELNTQLATDTKKNYKHLKFDCNVNNSTAEEFLENTDTQFDWIYIDPSRRNKGGKNTSIHNHTPNVVEIVDLMMEKSKNIMIKLSPMQDITECINMLKYVYSVYTISIKNEVKELLLLLNKSASKNPISITSVDLCHNDETIFTATIDERNTPPILSDIKKYIYQPGSSLVKANLQDVYTQQFGITKLHPNTQLYTSDEKVEDFFGKTFVVIGVATPSKKAIAKLIPGSKANVICKNFPLSPAQLSKKLKLKDGGDMFLIAFTDRSERKLVAVCKKA